MLLGLEHLHSKNIIHRDLKPDNILLQGETPRLADFGIARVLKTTSPYSTMIAGAPAYMAPEAYRGRRSEQTDLWAVGVILYQLLAGFLPFAREDQVSTMYAVLNDKPAPLTSSVPDFLRSVVTKSLAKEPEQRYRSAREMREAVQRFLHGRTPEASVWPGSEGDVPTIRSSPGATLTTGNERKEVSPLSETTKVGDAVERRTVWRVPARRPASDEAKRDSQREGGVPIDELVVAININQQYPYVRNAEDLYNCTRSMWRVDRQRASRAQYAFSVYQGVIKEVYKVDRWIPATDETIRYWQERNKEQERYFPPEVDHGRSEFVGELASEAIRQKYVGRQLPKRHSQNPILYFNCP